MTDKGRKHHSGHLVVVGLPDRVRIVFRTDRSRQMSIECTMQCREDLQETNNLEVYTPVHVDDGG